MSAIAEAWFYSTNTAKIAEEEEEESKGGDIKRGKVEAEKHKREPKFMQSRVEQFLSLSAKFLSI